MNDLTLYLSFILFPLFQIITAKNLNLYQFKQHAIFIINHTFLSH